MYITKNRNIYIYVFRISTALSEFCYVFFFPISSVFYLFVCLLLAALSLKPGDALVYKRRADILGKQGKKVAAIEDYKRAIVIQTTKR